MKKIFLILIAIASVTSGCVKYKEGPCMSRSSVKGKLYGYYNLTTYSVDNADSLILFKDYYGTSVEIYYNEVYSYDVLRIVGYRVDGVFIDMVCFWELSEDYKIFDIYDSNANGIYGTGPFKNKTSAWYILRLTNDDIKMKTNFNNKEYLIKFENVF
ncbi:MAG: hypothetical protein PHR81_00620 [Bacteroidales bacterium]|jgi:hypothetical protein|nr:hypothetical protein [Bacteroidales bacterium]MDD4213291.1 hypothetical protein [Bacteroidales bacterium]